MQRLLRQRGYRIPVVVVSWQALAFYFAALVAFGFVVWWVVQVGR